MFKSLYLKELRARRGSFLLLAGSILLWAVWLRTRIPYWPGPGAAVMAWLPLSFLPLWAIWSGVQSYRQEWSENTSYLLLSLPVRGWQIAVSKLLAIVTEIVGLTLVVSVMGLWLALVSDIHGPWLEVQQTYGTDWIPGIIAFGVVIALIPITLLIQAAQTAALISRQVQRFRALVLAAAYIFGLWAAQIFVDGLGSLLGFLPDLPLRLPLEGAAAASSLYPIPSGPIVAAVIFIALLLGLQNWLWENVVEI